MADSPHLVPGVTRVGDPGEKTIREFGQLPRGRIGDPQQGEYAAEPRLVHIPSELINAHDPNWGAGLLGDKANSMVFDNSKIKRVVPDFVCKIPFSRGAEEVMAWYDADPSRQVVDQKMDALMDKLIADYESIWPQQ